MERAMGDEIGGGEEKNPYARGEICEEEDEEQEIHAMKRGGDFGNKGDVEQ